MNTTVNYTKNMLISAVLVLLPCLYGSEANNNAHGHQKEAIISKITNNRKYILHPHLENHIKGTITQTIKVLNKISSLEGEGSSQFAFGIASYNHKPLEIVYDALGCIKVDEKTIEEMPKYEMNDLIKVELNLNNHKNDYYVNFILHPGKEQKKEKKVKIPKGEYFIFVKHGKNMHNTQGKVFEWGKFTIYQKKYQKLIPNQFALKNVGQGSSKNHQGFQKKSKKITNPLVAVISIGYVSDNTFDLVSNTTAAKWFFKTTFAYKVVSSLSFYDFSEYLNKSLLDKFLDYCNDILAKESESWDGIILYILGKEQEGGILTSDEEIYKVSDIVSNFNHHQMSTIVCKDLYSNNQRLFQVLVNYTYKLSSKWLCLSTLEGDLSQQGLINVYYFGKMNDIALGLNQDAALSDMKKRHKQWSKLLIKKTKEKENLKKQINNYCSRQLPLQPIIIPLPLVVIPPMGPI